MTSTSETSTASLPRVKVRGTIVEMDGDEMTRIIWKIIKERIIFPVFDLNLEYYDLGIRSRDSTQDAVTLEAAKATIRHGVAIKCATITADAARVKEFNLQKMWRSPNATIRNAIGGTIFREPILCSNVPRLVPHWTQPIVIGRHGFGDQYNAKDDVVPKTATGGTVELTFTPTGAAEPSIRHVVHKFGPESGGVMLAMFNRDDSIDDFARACFHFALAKKWPLYLSTKNTVLRAYDGRFKDRFAAIFATEGFAAKFKAAGIWYEHRLIDDMVAFSLRSSGAFVWACKNYDGDVQSDSVAQGYGSLGLMTSVLVSADGKVFESEAAHGTVTQHFRQHQQGKETSTNPVASIFAWTRGIARRGEVDGTPRVVEAARMIERATIAVIEGGRMTKDLALCRVHGDAKKLKRSDYLNTAEFLDAVSGSVRLEYAQLLAGEGGDSNKTKRLVSKL